MSKASDAIGWGILGFIGYILGILLGALFFGWVATLLLWPLTGIAWSIWQGAAAFLLVWLTGNVFTHALRSAIMKSKQ